MTIPLDLVVFGVALGPERLSFRLEACQGWGVELPALLDVLDLFLFRKRAGRAVVKETKPNLLVLFAFFFGGVGSQRDAGRQTTSLPPTRTPVRLSTMLATI